MNITTRPLDELKLHEKNVRKHPADQIREMIRSLEMFGQYRPIVIDESGTILAGNGLAMALKEMGATEAQVLEMDKLTEAEKKKLMIADNRVFMLGIDDTDNLFKMIESIGDFEIPGYDEGILRELMEDMEQSDMDLLESVGNPLPEPEQKPNENQTLPPAADTPEPRPRTCPHCGEEL